MPDEDLLDAPEAQLAPAHPDWHPPAHVGRPSKLTPIVRARLVQALEMGATYELACGFAGIHYSTLRDWMLAGERELDQATQENRDPAGDFYEFSEAIKSAEGRAAVKWLLKIEKAATEGNWQAAAWKLERRWPKVYGRTVVEQELSGQLQVTNNAALAASIIANADASRAAADLLAAVTGQVDPGADSGI